MRKLNVLCLLIKFIFITNKILCTSSALQVEKNTCILTTTYRSSFRRKGSFLLGSIRIGCKLITVHQSLENLSSFESGNKSSVRQSTRGNSLSVYHVKVHCLCFNNAHLYFSFRCRVSDCRWRDYYIGLDWSTPRGQGLR